MTINIKCQSTQTEEYFKQNRGLSRYNQGRDTEEQIENIAVERFGLNRKELLDRLAMETADETPIILNDLIEANYNRILNYKLAINELKDNDADLKILFSILIYDSQEYINDLSEEIIASGKEIALASVDSGKVYRKWTDLSRKQCDRQAILSGCVSAEEAVFEAYDNAMHEKQITSTARNLISEQQLQLKMSNQKIKELRHLRKIKTAA